MQLSFNISPVEILGIHHVCIIWGFQISGFHFFSHWISKQNTYELFQISSKLISCAPFTTFNLRRHLSKALAWELDIYLSNIGLQIQTPQTNRKPLCHHPDSLLSWIKPTACESAQLRPLILSLLFWIKLTASESAQLRLHYRSLQVPAEVSIVPKLKAALHISHLFLCSSLRHHTAA
jgi:hypothetical protein